MHDGQCVDNPMGEVTADYCTCTRGTQPKPPENLSHYPEIAIEKCMLPPSPPPLSFSHPFPRTRVERALSSEPRPRWSRYGILQSLASCSGLGPGLASQGCFTENDTL